MTTAAVYVDSSDVSFSWTSASLAVYVHCLFDLVRCVYVLRFLYIYNMHAYTGPLVFESLCASAGRYRIAETNDVINIIIIYQCARTDTCNQRATTALRDMLSDRRGHVKGTWQCTCNTFTSTRVGFPETTLRDRQRRVSKSRRCNKCYAVAATYATRAPPCNYSCDAHRRQTDRHRLKQRQCELLQ
jgi:hypothetical protein